MAENTAIGWTTHTLNFWVGCQKISPGCKFCYAERLTKRSGGDFGAIRRTKTWGDALRWEKQAAKSGERPMVFTCSMSDFFIEAADQWRPEAWEIIKRTPHLTYQILTKRPELIAERLPKDWGTGYPNVWLGVSCESPEYESRIVELLKYPAAVWFASLEPLLAPIDLNRWEFLIDKNRFRYTIGRYLDWVIVGGESGSERRECNPEWITDIVDQCRGSNTPVFVKQDSGPRAGQQGRIPDSHWVQEFPRAT